MPTLARIWFVFALLAMVPAAAQETPRPLDWSSDDGKRVADLAKTGRRVDGAHVVVWTPAAVSERDHHALAERLDRGVAALRDLVGAHPWQAIRQQKITYY